MTSARSSSLRPASLPGSSPRRTSLAIVCKQGIPLLYVGLRRVHMFVTSRQRCTIWPTRSSQSVGGRLPPQPYCARYSAVRCPIQRHTVPDTAPYGARYSAARCPIQRRTVPDAAPHGAPDSAARYPRSRNSASAACPTAALLCAGRSGHSPASAAALLALALASYALSWRSMSTEEAPFMDEGRPVD